MTQSPNTGVTGATTFTGAPTTKAEAVVICQELTVAELLKVVDKLGSRPGAPGLDDHGPRLEQRVLVVLDEGQPPIGQLVRARLQRQEIRGGNVRWIPER